MTHQNPAPHPTPRANALSAPMRCAFLASSAALVLLAGCGGEEKKKPRANTEPVEIERAPEPDPVTPIETLMSRYDIDPRIRLLEEDAPGTDAERIAVLTFFDSMASEKTADLQQMLSNEDRMEFNAMMANEQAGQLSADIREVRLQCGASPEMKPAVVAIIETYDGYHPQLWTYSVPSNNMAGMASVFTSAPTPIRVADVIVEKGQINKWYALLEAELMIANMPDIESEDMKYDLRNEVGDVQQGGGNSNPTGPGGAPGRVKPKNDKKFDAPKMPGFGN